MVSSVISSVDYDALSVYFVNSAVLLKKNGAIYLEGEEDIPFWNFVFMQGTPSSEFEFYYNVNLSAANKSEHHSGIGRCIQFFPFTSKQFLVCVDSDYSNLFGSPIPVSDFIFQTHTYSFENHLCFPETIKQLINTTTSVVITNDIQDFINALSPLCYELLTYSVVSEHILRDRLFHRHEFDDIFHITNANQPLNTILATIQQKINVKIASLHYDQAHLDAAILILTNNNINAANAYFYIKGHAIYDRCILKVIEHKFTQIKNSHIATLSNADKSIYVTSVNSDFFINKSRVFDFASYDEIIAIINKIIYYNTI